MPDAPPTARYRTRGFGHRVAIVQGREYRHLADTLGVVEPPFGGRANSDIAWRRRAAGSSILRSRAQDPCQRAISDADPSPACSAVKRARVRRRTEPALLSPQLLEMALGDIVSYAYFLW